MALHRKIDWNAAMRDKRKNRAALAASGLLAEEAATIPFAVAGCYDRSAIMEAVIALARAQLAGSRRTCCGMPLPPTCTPAERI
jgi:hypothetical protein